MNVETGSMKSGSGADAAGLSTPTATSPLSSPISSPIVDAVIINESDPIAIKLDSSPDPSLLGALRGPVASLKAPRRTASTLSVSSMVVENGSVASDGVGNLDEVRTPTGLDGKTSETETFPSTVGAEGGTGLGLEVEMEENEDTEKAKEARTKAELDRYEKEVEDATMAPEVEDATMAPEVEETVEVANERVEEPAKEIVDEAAREVVEEKSEAPIVTAAVLLEETEDSLAAPSLGLEASSIEALVSAEPVLPAAMPVDTTQVGLAESTQSDDENQGSEGGYGDFLEEFDEDEETAGLGPSGMPLVKCSDCSQEVDLLELADHTCAPKSPSLDALPAAVTAAPPSLSRAIPDVPQDDEEEEEDELADPNIGRSLSSRPMFLAAAADSPLDATPRHMSVSHSVSSLDEFVPQSESLIPDDVLDDYADDAPDSSIAPPSFPVLAARPVASEVPQDLEDDDAVEELSGAPQMSRSASGRRLPGVDDSDEEWYEGGSVTIVRQTLSHRTTESG